MTNKNEMNKILDGMIKVDDFCLFGKKVVFVAGTRVLPVSKDDLYTQRIYYICNDVTINGERINLNYDKGFSLYDPKDLKKVSKYRQTKYTKALYNSSISEVE